MKSWNTPERARAYGSSGGNKIKAKHPTIFASGAWRSVAALAAQFNTTESVVRTKAKSLKSKHGKIDLMRLMELILNDKESRADKSGECYGKREEGPDGEPLE